MIRCTECKSKLIKETAYVDWLKLFNFIEFLYLETYIEGKTYEEMLNSLMTLKPEECEI
jgi:hypothetical protein